MSTRRIDMKDRVAKVWTEQEVSSKLNAELLTSAGWKGAMGTRTEHWFLETSHPTSIAYALHIEKVIVSYYCKDVFEHILLNFESS